MKRFIFSWNLFLWLSLGAVVSAPAAGYQDGVYLGLAHDGPLTVKVRVTVEEGRITDILFLEMPEWEAPMVKTNLRRRILDNQSVEVSGVTGATLSSKLVKAAVAEALKQAQPPAPLSPSAVSPPPSGPSPVVVMETTKGAIEIQLFPGKAPRAVENFLGLVKKKYYNGTVFHRVIPNFMIQGGDPTGSGRGGESLWGKTFQDEFSPDLKFNKAGLLAMANSGANTNGSQFFITVVLTPWLNRRHTIFGEVCSGFEVVEAISRVPTGPGDRPVEEQKIIRAYVK